ncbi:MAG: hypothetical protein M1825_000555 [Sarcosagium campestre]|nr:MAG: hypothetical protein M1825_000555 [Sarcosagium campestre]
MAVVLSADQSILFSSACDRVINVWDTTSMERRYNIYSSYDVGDIFCVAYSSTLQTAYFGAQNTTIQWYDFKEKDSRPAPDLTNHPSYRRHRFFDSIGPDGQATPRPVPSEPTTPCATGGQVLEIDNDHLVMYAHYGYVFCMFIASGVCRSRPDSEVLISGGGDGTIKLWDLDRDDHGRISEISTLRNGSSSVLSMALNGSLLYCGLLGGDINVWDLDTEQLVRSVKAHARNIQTMTFHAGFLYSGAAAGQLKMMNEQSEITASWQAHNGLILASAVAEDRGRQLLVTGGGRYDRCISIWDITNVPSKPTSHVSTNEAMLESLSMLISHRTVSSDPSLAEECRRGATSLRNLFKRFGASTEMFNTEDKMNPIVFAKFNGNPAESSKRKRILFYGHYDVIAANGEQGSWATDPFRMEGIDGYLYGRGASDNKGPVLAALYGVVDLIAEQALDSDILFLIEGEEEYGSRGFENAVIKNQATIGHVDYIILSNSYWINDTVPCLTYGLRGVLLATVTVESNREDLHSGVHGSSLMNEALKDLVAIVSKLTGPKERVEIPGFYDPIFPVTKAESARYDAIVEALQDGNSTPTDAESIKASLMRKWREPSLTLHGFNVSGPNNSTIIPQQARVTLSIRLVPNQEVSKVQESLIAFLQDEFRRLETANKLSITINHSSEPWLGDPDNEIFQTLEKAVMDAWSPSSNNKGVAAAAAKIDTNTNTGTKNNTDTDTDVATAIAATLDPITDLTESMQKLSNTADDTLPLQSRGQRRPLYIREGGSIRTVRFLEKTLNAPAANLPCGQASDAAHLDNERLRIKNLYKSRSIFKQVFLELPTK